MTAAAAPGGASRGGRVWGGVGGSYRFTCAITLFVERRECVKRLALESSGVRWGIFKPIFFCFFLNCFAWTKERYL